MSKQIIETTRESTNKRIETLLCFDEGLEITDNHGLHKCFFMKIISSGYENMRRYNTSVFPNDCEPFTYKSTTTENMMRDAHFKAIDEYKREYFQQKGNG